MKNCHFFTKIGLFCQNFMFFQVLEFLVIIRKHMTIKKARIMKILSGTAIFRQKSKFFSIFLKNGKIGENPPKTVINHQKFQNSAHHVFRDVSFILNSYSSTFFQKFQKFQNVKVRTSLSESVHLSTL